MMSFMTLPPEINSLLMYTGAGSSPMLEAATAWDGLASELGSAASSFMSVTSGLTGQAWQGPASAAMMAAAAPLRGVVECRRVTGFGGGRGSPGGGRRV
jgi:PPE-repeat protein